MVNDRGGVKGRKINFISRDDGYSPPKTIEVARQLVEQEHVLLVFTSLGTPTNLAIRGYMAAVASTSSGMSPMPFHPPRAAASVCLL